MGEGAKGGSNMERALEAKRRSCLPGWISWTITGDGGVLEEAGGRKEAAQDWREERRVSSGRLGWLARTALVVTWRGSMATEPVRMRPQEPVDQEEEMAFNWGEGRLVVGSAQSSNMEALARRLGMVRLETGRVRGWERRRLGDGGILGVAEGAEGALVSIEDSRGQSVISGYGGVVWSQQQVQLCSGHGGVYT